jgi:hypothetical protein
MTEFLIKNILSEILFENKICENLEDHSIVNYLYKELLCEKLLYGEPVTVPELRKILHNKIVNFEFIKLNGEIRPAKGTTMMKYVPQSQHPKGIRPSSPKVATFYDLMKKNWRSVSQRSKEIVLKKDDMTGKPVIMVKDKPDGGGDIAVKDTKDFAVGDVYLFSKSKNIKYQSGDKKKYFVDTWITITRETDEGTWGVTAGSNTDILLTPERLNRIKEPMKVGDEYQYKQTDQTKNTEFTTIEIIRKDDQGFWGKTPTSSQDILLTPEELQNVHKYEQPEVTIDGQPIEEPEEVKPEVTKVKPIKKTEGEKRFYFINPVTKASMIMDITPKDAVKKLKEMGRDWRLASEDDYNKHEEAIETTSTKKPIEMPETPKEETIIKPKGIINKEGEDLDNIEADEL